MLTYYTFHLVLRIIRLKPHQTIAQTIQIKNTFTNEWFRKISNEYSLMKMINSNSSLKKLPFIMLLLFSLGCGEDEVSPTGKSETYTIDAYNGTSVTAVATLKELSNGYTRVELALSGTESNLSYLAHIHSGNVNNFGNIVAQLRNSNTSNTLISEDLTNTLYSFEDWLSFDGYIAIHIDDDDVYPIVAVGNIGSNTD